MASCTPERLNAASCTPLLACDTVSLSGKVEQADSLRKLTFSGGGASKPHRSKYILVVDRFV
jgi:hypothetical protein